MGGNTGEIHIGSERELYKYIVFSHFQRIGLHGGQPRSWCLLLNTEKRTKEKMWQRLPPLHAACSEEKNEKKRDASICLGATQVSVPRPYKDSFDSSTSPMSTASQNSTLLCAITTFPVSLPLFSGDAWPRLPLLSSTRP